ncbi:MAG: glutamate-1-semialdehyde 2,1-aminomutase [Bacteroidota bacterium]
MTDFSRYARSREHQARAHRLIPGGAHTYAKGDDQMPEAMPVVIERGEGCRVWDVDGNGYIEYGMGLRSVTLGHAEPRVNEAARRAMDAGLNFTRPASVELRAAEVMADLIPSAERVKFCKDGSSATTAAVKLARAATGRDPVAICSQQPFISQNDWFIGTTPMNAGVPQAVRDLTVAFPYGDLAALEAVLDEHRPACVVMEAVRDASDPSGYIHDCVRVCRERSVVFVLDEMITGFRWDRHGAQGLFDIDPDLATFGKALANGFSCSALVGKADLMDLGGLITEADRVFLLSATHGAETVGLGAALETLRIYREEDVTGTMHRQGARLREGVRQQVERYDLDGFFGTAGRDCNLVFYTRDADGNASQPYRTLFLQEMTARGILAPSFVISAAHDDDAVDRTIEAVGEVLPIYKQALDAGSVDGFLVGRPVQPVFRRKNGTVWSAEASPSGDGSAIAVSRVTRTAHTPS